MRVAKVALVALVLLPSCIREATVLEEESVVAEDGPSEGCDPLTLEEIQDVPRRGTVNDAMESAERIVGDYGSRHPEQYAERFVTADTVFVGFTGDVCSHVKSVKKLLPTWNVRGFVADYSLQELSRFADRITDEWDLLEARGVELTGVGVRGLANRVEVMLADVSDEAKQVLDERYGLERLVVFEGRAYTAS